MTSKEAANKIRADLLESIDKGVDDMSEGYCYSVQSLMKSEMVFVEGDKDEKKAIEEFKKLHPNEKVIYVEECGGIS